MLSGKKVKNRDPFTLIDLPAIRLRRQALAGGSAAEVAAIYNATK